MKFPSIRFVFMIATLAGSVLAGSEAVFGQARSSANRYRMMLKALEEDTTSSSTGQEKAESKLDRASAPDALEGRIDPAEYELGPGDELAVAVSGREFLAFPLTVLPEGDVIVRNIGTCNVSGKTITQAESLLTGVLSPLYRDATVRMMLTKMRHFQVHVQGRVEKREPVVATPVDRVHSVIERAGGFSKKGNAYIRKIRVSHRDGTDQTVDLYPFYMWGDQTCDPHVRDGDVIFVSFKSQANSVGVYGEVGLQGEFQFAETDSFSTVLRMAQGLLPSAFLDSIEVSRFGTDGISSQRFYVSWPAVAGSGLPEAVRAAHAADFPLRAGDQVFVREIPKWHYSRQVAISGEVKYPGRYAIAKDSTTLSEIVDRARGFTDEASIDDVELIRRSGMGVVDREFERLQKMIPSEMTKEEYEYLKAKSRERQGVMVVDFRRLFLQKDRSADVVLHDEDSIYVPLMRNYISIIGRVNNPGRLRFSTQYRFEDYVQLAGGYGYRADETNVRVIKTRTGEMFDPRGSSKYALEPGDTIFVPEINTTDIWPAIIQGVALTAQVLGVLFGVYALLRR